MSSSAPLIEIFSSIQGEGSFVGMPMAFVRTAVCPIRCLYCDTPHSYEAPEEFPVRTLDGDRTEPNPVSARRAAELVLALGMRRVSVTGGEPLLYPEFVNELGAELRAGGCSVHLETAALHPKALRQVLGAVDHLSADYKLPGTVERGDFREQHRACLELAAAAGSSIDVKIVVTPSVSRQDVEQALDHLIELRRQVILILQPVTPFGRVTAAPARDTVAELAALAEGRGFDLRVLPQVHKALGLP